MERNVLQAQASALKGLRMLVVEPDTSNRNLYTIVLEGLGAEVVAVVKAGAALAVVAEFNPDLLISDIVLPDESCHTFIHKLRAIEAPLGRHTPTLAVTGFIDSHECPPALAAGFDRWLSKPIDLNLFVRTILEMLGLNR